VADDAPFSLYNRKWPLHTHYPPLPPATFIDTDDCKVKIANSLISGGCFIQGSQIQRSILGFRCNIGPCSHISESVLLGDVKIGEGCSIRRAIIDKNVEIAPGTVIGENLDHDRERFTVSEGGIVVVPKGARVGY
jgi:glucose-1-phosphate adenylyltransferase